jgi:hypothetical protein
MTAKLPACVPNRAVGSRGRFKKGDSKPEGSGRKRGTPNRMTTTLKEAVIAAAELVGEKKWNEKTGEYEPGEGGLVGYMVHLALHNESVFAMLLGRVLPMHFNAEVRIAPKRYETEEEVRAMCEERGIPFEPLFDPWKFES